MDPATIGLILAGLSAASSAFQKKPKSKQFPTLSPEQTGFQNQLIQMLQGQLGGDSAFGESQSYLKNLLSGSPEATAAFEKPYMRQFNEEIVPQLAEKFAGLGAGGLSSSYFQKALGSAGAGLQEKLAALRSGLQLSAVPLAQQGFMGLINPALQSRFATGITPGSPGAFAETLAPIAQGYGQSIGQHGLQLPSWLTSLFGGKTSPVKQ